MSGTGYEIPGHPLQGVPVEVLEAGRKVVRDAADWGDVDPELADSVADAVVAATIPSIRGWLATLPPTL